MQLAPAWLPALLHPSLTQQRLGAIAQIIWEQATLVAQIAEPERGDNGWVTGCRRHQWIRYALSKAAVGELVDYLSVTPRSSHFVIKVAMVPLRIYRGDRQKPVPTRYATPSRLEAEQFELAFGTDHPLSGPLRIVLETDARGMPQRVCFARVSSDAQLIDVTEIPVDRGTSKVVPLMKAEPKATIAPLSLADAAARARRRPRLEHHEGA